MTTFGLSAAGVPLSDPDIELLRSVELTYDGGAGGAGASASHACFFFSVAKGEETTD